MSALPRTCRIATGLFILLYLAALALLLVGRYGLFGQERDPLAGVFLVPLGIPWNRAIDLFPEAAWPALAISAPAVNVVLLIMLCRMIARANVRRGLPLEPKGTQRWANW